MLVSEALSNFVEWEKAEGWQTEMSVCHKGAKGGAKEISWWLDVKQTEKQKWKNKKHHTNTPKMSQLQVRGEFEDGDVSKHVRKEQRTERPR